MNDQRPRPSRLVTWMLRRVSSRDAAEAAIGDILEELDERRAVGRTPRWASLWLSRQVLGAVLAEATAELPRLLRSIGHTLRDAARALRRKPAQALFILMILAVGISAATVTFSVVDAVVLKPLPFDQSDQIVWVGGRNQRGQTGLSSEEFRAIHDRVAGFDGVAALSASKTPVTFGGHMVELTVMHSTAELFRVLRLKPAIGRLWTPEDENRGDTHVAIIGYDVWQGRFGGDPAVLDRVVRLGDDVYRIAGVLPAGVEFPSRSGWTIDMWVPQAPEKGAKITSRMTSTLGRVRPDVPLSQLVAQVQRAVAPLADANRAAYADWHPELRNWRETLIGDVRGWMLLILGAVAVVMLIACVNAANLMLTRSAERARELAVRASLGASRRALAMSLVAESLMLSSAAAICGLLFAVWGVGVAKAALPRGVFRAGDIGLNGRVLLASVVAALVTGLLFGTVPAWQASRVSVVALLKDSGSTVTGGRRRWRSVFLIAEVACIGGLLVVSTLFIASFVRVTTLDLGFRRSNLIAVATVTDYKGTVDDVKGRLSEIPGVTGVAAVTASSPPLIGVAFGGAWADSDLQPVDGDVGGASVNVELYKVSPDYFDVAGIPFRRGSTWQAAAVTAGVRPMVIDEMAARRMFGDHNPLGQQVRAHDLNNDIFTVVGVVPHAFARGPDESERPSAYFALTSGARPSWVSFLLRTSVPPPALVSDVETVMASLAPPTQSAGAGVRVLDDAFWQLTATRRFNAGVMSVFALIALIIGGAGIYAVMASVVNQQTRDIGIRVALGATAMDIRRRVLANAGRNLLVGLAVGLPAGWWMSRGFGAIFFQVRPSDLSIYAIVAVTIAAVALVATLVPANRASRVDPIISLRAE